MQALATWYITTRNELDRSTGPPTEKSNAALMSAGATDSSRQKRVKREWYYPGLRMLRANYPGAVVVMACKTRARPRSRGSSRVTA
jgi:hypothetical protein